MGELEAQSASGVLHQPYTDLQNMEYQPSHPIEEMQTPYSPVVIDMDIVNVAEHGGAPRPRTTTADPAGSP